MAFGSVGLAAAVLLEPPKRLWKLVGSIPEGMDAEDTFELQVVDGETLRTIF